MSGMRRSRYSRGAHFKSWKKIIRFFINILKIFVLVILYLIVRNLQIQQKIDKRRQEWTCSILLFYNYIFLAAISLSLAIRVTTNQTLLVIETIIMNDLYISRETIQRLSYWRWLPYFSHSSLSVFSWMVCICMKTYPIMRSIKIPNQQYFTSFSYYAS